MLLHHTPGPWRIGDAGATVFGPKTGSPSPETVATVTQMPLPTERQKANARLIAAAPELLAALWAAQTVLGEYVHGETPEMCAMAEALEDATAAIAKAEGR